MQTTEAMKRRVAELETQRKAISTEIRQLKRTIWQREHYKSSVNENSLVRQTFGKSVKDLTPSERKKYDAMRQTETRKKSRKRLLEERIADAKYSQLENALQTEEAFEEICPLCDHVNEFKVSEAKDYKNGKKVVVCQNCGSVIFACNLCDCDGCGKCYIEEGYKF